MALYSIGYVARYYGVSVSTIRRWEAKGIIPKSIRTFGGHRRFDLAPSESSKQGLHIGYVGFLKYLNGVPKHVNTGILI